MSHFIDIDGQEVPIKLRWNKQAKRLIMRMNPKEEGVVVTLPHGVDEEDGIKMAEKNSVWIANQLSKKAEHAPFEDGAMIPILGLPHKISHQPEARGTVWCEDQTIFVAGKADFLNRRLTDWLKKKAKAEITPLAHEMAHRLGKKVNRISVRDTVSRWGSCSSNGNLSFNWRLVLAPHEILEYVVAHEVSHLRHMDHSPAFWQTVDSLGVNSKKCRHWLKKHGHALQRHGP